MRAKRLRYWARPAWLAAAVAAVTLGPLASTASAQGVGAAPDVRNIPPVVMLLVDTSGSMEHLPSCVCQTPSCDECNPQCGTGTQDQRNKWAYVLEALTGQWQNFTCQQEARTGSAFAGAPDQGIKPDLFLPPIGTPQLNNGILDVYIDRVKFGLMTFDPVSTFTDLGTDLLPKRLFDLRLNDNVQAAGGFSYGEPKPFTFPGCGETYEIDNGARNANATMGQLVSVGSDAANDREAVNQAIQNDLLNVRPFGGTPIAGMLDDVRYYFNNNPDVAPVKVAGGAGDPYAECRSKYVVLLTDGEPGADMRGPPVNCDTAGYTCPYDLPENIAGDMCQFTGGTNGKCTGIVNGVFVVGFDIDDPQVKEQLNAIADLGGTAEFATNFDDPSGQPYPPGALYATHLNDLVQALALAIDHANPGTPTRTVPAFANSGLAADQQSQSQLNTGFQMGDAGKPWSGVLERERFTCDSSLTPKAQPITQADQFQQVLMNRVAPRNLFTVVPDNLNDLDGRLAGEDTGLAPVSAGGNPSTGNGSRGPGGAPTMCGGGGSGNGGGGSGNGGSGSGNAGGNSSNGNGPTNTSPAETGLSLTPFQVGNAKLTPQVFGVSTQAQADDIIQWVQGGPGTGRPDVRLGDIYHSSPVVVGPPQQDLPDESYNLFRQLPDVANRPTVVYVGTNDGVLHCFAVNDTTITGGDHAGTVLKAGQELWGFVPPMLLRKLQSAETSHQWMVDGTPVVRDMFFARAPGATPDGSIYHTVLVVGMRGGGNGYIGLDVTDPLNPKFLFQFADPSMGETYGQAALGEVLVQTSQGLQERGFVFLPGGKGDDLTTQLCGGATVGPDGRLTQPIGCPSRGKGQPPNNSGTTTARQNQRCWDTTGRDLFFVDLATGDLIRTLNDQVFNAPLSGSASIYPGGIGQVATQVFLTDADGVIWRVDVSSQNMRDWDAEPFFDMFYDGGATSGQPAYFPPVISTTNDNKVVVIQGTGDIDNLAGQAANRVVSLTENITYKPDGSVDTVTADPNWIIRLDPGEQVTGPIELFDGNVYFATFKTSSDATNACKLGDSYIWGASYLNAQSGTTDPEPGLPGAQPNQFVLKKGPYQNEVIMGLAVNQAPTCLDLRQVSETDPFLGARSFQQVAGTGGGQFELVALSSQGTNRPAGGHVSEERIALPPPQSFTDMQSFAGTVE